MEVRRLILEGQVTLGSTVSPEQVNRMRERYAQRNAVPAGVPQSVERPSEQEQALRDKIDAWIKRHAYGRWPGESPAARSRRVAYLRDVNTALLKAFGRRDRLRLDKLQVLWEHIQRHYPV